jgi:hypothetical protein
MHRHPKNKEERLKDSETHENLNIVTKLVEKFIRNTWDKEYIKLESEKSTHTQESILK